MLCIECFDLWVLMKSLKSTKRPASRFSKNGQRPAGRDPLAEDLIKHQQISQLIIDLLSPKAQGRLTAHRLTDSILYISQSISFDCGKFV